MHSNYLRSYILEQAGLKMSTYQESLLTLKETVPIIGQGAACSGAIRKHQLGTKDLLPLTSNIFDKTNLVVVMGGTA